jgi:hypothetical protein
VGISVKQDLWGAEEKRADSLDASLLVEENLGEAKVYNDRPERLRGA